MITSKLKNKNILVTGGAGFLGSHLVDRLVKIGSNVVVYDNLTTGNEFFLRDSIDKIRFIKADIMDFGLLCDAMKDIDMVFHIAAHADVKNNVKQPVRCLQQNTLATSNVLEAMRKNNVKNIAFSSSGSVYGEPEIFPTPEDAPFPIQTSMYGASKAACEGLLQAYSVGYGFNVYIFRFVSLMGERYTHGCIFDFYNKLKKDSKKLEILGNGKQLKSYLYVKDCVDAIMKVITTSDEKINIYNIGHDDYLDVTSIAEIVCRELNLKDVKFNYTGGIRGWIGDSPFIHLDISKIKSLGWKPSLTIPQCAEVTINWLKENRSNIKRDN